MQLLIARDRVLKHERAILVVLLLVAVGFALLRLVELRADMPSTQMKAYTGGMQRC